MKNQQPVGLHIDIIGAALAELGITPEYQPTTWESCLYRAKAGSVDAVATAAYLDERAAYMNYPKDASDANQSLWRITQVEYKVITPTFNPDGTPNHYVFNGDLSTLPEPVRVPAGYFIVHDLQKAGVKVKQNKNSMDNFQGLISDQTGSVIDLTEVATHLSMQADFGGKMQVQTNPFVVKSYYLAFSKKGNVSPPQAQVIWEHLAKVRENSKLMAGFLKQY